MNISDITATDSQNDLIGPHIIKEYRGKVSKGRKTDECMRTLAIYNSSIFQEFEIFLRTKVDLVENGIRLVLDKGNSRFLIYNLEPGLYTFKDICEDHFNILQPEYELFNNSADIEFDDITMNSKLVV